MTPVDFIPKMSQVACVLQCGGIWIGGKGWGLTWKLNQCIVKPREIVSVYGKCQVQLSVEECQVIDTQEIKEDVDDTEQYASKGVVGGLTQVQSKNTTYVEDSDDEKELPTPQPVVEEVEAIQPSQEQEAEIASEVKPVKKIVKKAVTPAPAPEPEQEPAEAPKKKVVKKKV
jgi:hypothetical protein